MRRLRAATARVPASTSNLGSGFDCLGVAVDRYLTAEFDPGGRGLRVVHEALDTEHDGVTGGDLVLSGFRAGLERGSIDSPAGTLRIRSEIPIGRGLGSSAAATVAGLALAELATSAADRVVDRHGLLQRAAAEEGHPDNAAPAILGGLVSAVSKEDGSFHAFRLPLSERIGFAFAAPHVRVSTRAARRVLPAAVPHATAARALGRLTALLRGLATGDGAAIALGLRDELHVPYRLRLIPGGPEAIAAAREAGAWGATISGSGSGLLAICEPHRCREVAAAMAASFATAASGPLTQLELRPVFEGLCAHNPKVRPAEAPA